jgi:hypothetical protein
MADIRIKDLTTTASTTAADDFFAADGATNGTRKLSAYSPSFGGNATVGGTLTVNGTGTNTISGTTVLSGSGTVQASLSQSSTGQVGLEFTRAGGTAVSWVAYIPTGSTDLRLFAGSSDQFIFSGAGRLSIPATTASTSTSSGALVVGNGTSGGLGVGGAIWGGGKVHVGSAGYADGGAKLNVYATPSDAGYLYGIRLSDNSTATLALGLQTPTGTTSSFIHSNIALGFGTVGTAALNINTSQQVQVLTSTASTSTSSGALVVSGGVGVAGSQYLGIKLNISTHDSSAGGIGFGTETNLYRYQAGGLALDHASGAAPGLLFRENGTSTLRLETNSGVGYLSTLTAANLILRTNATTALTLDTSQNAFFAGTIRTAAPSGGTAASWKLGSVATVSPTSPNRTIEVDIGGTIYYIHAKTTNN